jgi:hypothetical protein
VGVVDDGVVVVVVVVVIFLAITSRSYTILSARDTQMSDVVVKLDLDGKARNKYVSLFTTTSSIVFY